MRWWAWLILAVVGLPLLFVVLSIAVVLRFRRTVQREFVGFLRERRPELKVVSQRHLLLETTDPAARRGTIDLHNLYKSILHAQARTPQARRPFYDQWLKFLEEGDAMGTSPLGDAQKQRIMPRLVTDEMLRDERFARELPTVPVGETGLHIAFVLDGEQSVLYLTWKHLEELGASVPELTTLALDNLRKTFPPEPIVRGVLDKPSLSTVKMLDTYDAARLLLLPEGLRAGEALLAAVPDRDTLVILPVPPDADLSKLGGLLTPGSDKLLLNRILKVTADGIELA